VGNVELAALLGAAVLLGPLAWRFVRATGGLRQGWEPAGAAVGDEAGAATIAPAGDPRTEVGEPVGVAGRRP
jgi:hypothetical protein